MSLEYRKSEFLFIKSNRISFIYTVVETTEVGVSISGEEYNNLINLLDFNRRLSN